MGLLDIVARFAGKILDFDDTAVPVQQLMVINDVLAKRNVIVEGSRVNEMLHCIKRKHLLNSVTVSEPEGNFVFSSEGDGNSEARKAAGLLKHLAKSFSGTDIIAFREEKDWVMVMFLNGRNYVVKANSSLSTAELRALAKEIEGVLQTQAAN